MGDISLNDVTNSSDNWTSVGCVTNKATCISLNDVKNSSDTYDSVRYKKGQSATVTSGSVTKRPVRCRNISIIVALFAIVVLAVVVTIVVLVVLKKSGDGCELGKFGNVDIYSPNGTGIGSTAVGKCKPGFHGPAHPLKCLPSGLWDSPPHCTPVECGEPGWTNANISVQTGTTFGSTAIANCRTGFGGGSRQVTCNQEGNWTGGPDCTVIYCGEAVWENADISARTGTIFGSTATASCRSGFDGGSKTVTCGADKLWTGGPTCAPVDCGVAEWENADISDQNGTIFGSTATAACRPGFDGGSQTVTCGADKPWTGGPTCTPVDCGDAVCENADISAQTGTTFGSTATARCRPGFNGGYADIACNTTGLWVGCSRVDCGEAIWENANIYDQTGTTFCSTATATCRPGFDGGHADIACNTTGLWVGGPACSRVDCGSVYWKNADISDRAGSKFGSTATATCRSGFFGGFQTITCGADKRWTGGHPCLSLAQVRCNQGAVFLPHPDACQLYYDCSKPDPNSSDMYRTECPYPQQFNLDILECDDFTQVDCGSRADIKEYCKYQAHNTDGCMKYCGPPCSHYHPSCLGLSDGNNVYQEREWSAYYATCFQERLVSTDICPDDEGTLLFHPELKQCVPLDNIPQEHGGTMPGCLGLSDGNNVYQNREWSPYYVTCFQERLVSTEICPDDEGTQIFHLEQKQCVPRDKIPREFGGTMPDCSGLPDGLHADHLNRCSQYTVCEGEISVDTVKCPDGLVFDSVNLTCVYFQHSCSPPPCGEPSNWL